VDQLWQFFEGESPGGTLFAPESILLSLVLAFVLGQLVAWVYYATHSGLSYSKSFTQSLILITVVVALVMAVIGNSIITAFGLMGALAIVRFRNVVKDTRDIAFLFCALVVGMAAGSQRFAVAIVGAGVLCLVAVYLFLTGFGTHQPHNGFLRFTLIGAMGPEHPLPGILKRFCKSFILVSAHDASFGGAAEYAYQVMVRDYTRNEEMLFELEKIQGIQNVTLTLQEELLEV
jgi:hypothetical protein